MANPEDIELDEGAVEEEEAAEAMENIQLETKPVPVRCPNLIFWSFPERVLLLDRSLHT